MSCRLSGARDCFSSGYRVDRACGAFVLNKFRPSGKYKAVESQQPSDHQINSMHLRTWSTQCGKMKPTSFFWDLESQLATHEKPLGEALHEVEANSVGKP